MATENEWFVSNGCIQIEIASDDQRESAHQFYESLRFARDGQRFAKIMSGLIDPLWKVSGPFWRRQFVHPVFSRNVCSRILLAPSRAP